MKITLSVIKADIGSIGGHIAPSQRLLAAVREHVAERGRGLIIDHAVSHTGDDIAILMTHTRGVGDENVHKLASNAFVAGTGVARARAAEKAMEMRRQGFFGAAMLPMSELEYTDIAEKLAELEPRLRMRAPEAK